MTPPVRFSRYRLLGLVLLVLLTAFLASHTLTNLAQGQAPLTIAATATANVELIAQLRTALVSLLQQLVVLLTNQLNTLLTQRGLPPVSLSNSNLAVGSTQTTSSGGGGGGSSNTSNVTDDVTDEKSSPDSGTITLPPETPVTVTSPPSAPSPEISSPLPVGSCASISQYGITWTFDKAYSCGQFVNGDYWVVGPATVTDITPKFTGTQHGFEINPSNVVQQGFDSRAYYYNATLVPQLPKIVQPNSSIVKAISKTTDTKCSFNSNHTCYLETAAVLTVLDRVPENKGATVFRPGYFGSKKNRYLTSELQPEKLLSLQSVARTPTLATVERKFQRVQLDHQLDWVGRLIHPQDNMQDYGADIALDTNDAALRLMLNDSIDTKMPALINYVQAGIDFFSILDNGGRWLPNGGHMPGRKLPIAFAGFILNNTAMKEAIMNASKSIPIDFDEDGGIVYSPKANDGSGVVLFGQIFSNPIEKTFWNVYRYANAGGSKTFPDPYGYIDGGDKPGLDYDTTLLGPWKGAALAVKLIPELGEIWNNARFLEFVDRRVNSGLWMQPDPCAPMDGVCVGGTNAGGYCSTAKQGRSVCVKGLTQNDGWCNDYCPLGSCDYNANWLTNYGVTYGPDGNGGCIADTNPADGIGRFPSWHGAKDVGGYKSLFVESMWSAYYK